MKKLFRIVDACAPLALCHASGADEETVLRVATSYNFKPGRGMLDWEWLQAAADLGLKLEKVRIKRKTLKRFLEMFPIGLYIVGTHDHLFCVDNGVVFDPRERMRVGMPANNRFVVGVWRVIS